MNDNDLIKVLKDAVGPANVSFWRSHGMIHLIVGAMLCIPAAELRVVVGHPRFVNLSTRYDGCMTFAFKES